MNKTEQEVSDNIFDLPIDANRTWAVTGTKHGSIIYAETEGEARRAFHTAYNGESILYCNDRTKPGYTASVIFGNDF